MKMSCQNKYNHSNKDEIEVELVNWNPNGKIGFSITGGVGSQHIRGDDGIYVKSIQEGGLISWDGRIWVGDKIVAVKSGLEGQRINLTGCTHEVAVSILKKVCTSTRVVLIVKKCEVTLINWKKNDPLGFSISGGVNREHIPGDCRIYITSIVECGNASRDGRLSVGDRLLGVKQNLKSKGMRSEDFFLMDKCKHEDAVSALQEARKGKDVVLIISKVNNDHHRLRFDDNEMMSNNELKSKDNSPNRIGTPSQSPNKTSTHKEIKSILKPKKSFDANKISRDEGLGDSLRKSKSPVRIKYITGEPINNEPIDIHNKCSDSENNHFILTKTPETNLARNIDTLSLVRSNDKRNWSGSSNSSSSSIYEYDSALSSMSSEDESNLLNFSKVENALTEDYKPKPGHQRQRSKHLIEPLISKSEAPDSNFSRPVLNKERMFLSSELKDGIVSQEIINQERFIPIEITKVPNNQIKINPSNKYFNQRYNISNHNDNNNMRIVPIHLSD